MLQYYEWKYSLLQITPFLRLWKTFSEKYNFSPYTFTPWHSIIIHSPISISYFSPHDNFLFSHLLLISANYGVKISSITVPRSVDNTTTEPAKLNCIFEYDQPSEANIKDRELVVKWKLNNSTVLYQWVYKGTPSVNKHFKDYIDTRHEVSPDTKPTSMPLTIIRKSVDLTGQYTCLVTTITTEDSADAELQVYGESTFQKL